MAYRDRTVLDDLSIRLEPGFTGLLGVNGAGKSTLLGVLAGLTPPSSGGVSLDDVDLYGSDRREARARIALVPQSLDLPGRLRVDEFLHYLAWLRAVPPAARSRRVADALEQLDLQDRRTSPLAQLSGGMRRRVLIAQALIAHPDVLLLDEPTTGLDPEQRHQVRSLVARLGDDRTVLMSSHVVEDLAVLSSRLLVLDGGRLRFDGTVDELRFADGSRPGDLEAGFLAVVRGGHS